MCDREVEVSFRERGILSPGNGRWSMAHSQVVVVGVVVVVAVVTLRSSRTYNGHFDYDIAKRQLWASNKTVQLICRCATTTATSTKLLVAQQTTAPMLLFCSLALSSE